MNKNSDRKILYVIFSALIISILTLSVAYAALSSALKVSGVAAVQSATWDVHFRNINVTDGSVVATKTPTIVNPTSVEFGVTLDKPGDFFDFTVDIVNSGTIDAMIENIVKTPELTAEQQRYLKYDISYYDGSSILVNHLLSNNKQKTIRVRLEYRKDINIDDIPKTSQDFNLGFTLKYSQSNEGATIPNGGSGNNIFNENNVCQVDDVQYLTLDDAINYSKRGSTIKLLKDTTVPTLVLNNELTLDLNKKNLTTSSVEVFNKNYIIDNSLGEGKIIVPKDKVKINNGNNKNYLPVFYNDGYMFSKISYLQINMSTIEPRTFKLVFRPYFSSHDFEIKYFSDGFQDNEISLICKDIRIDASGKTQESEFLFNDKIVIDVYANNRGFYTTFYNTENKISLITYAVLRSNTGVSIKGKELDLMKCPIGEKIYGNYGDE